MYGDSFGAPDLSNVVIPPKAGIHDEAPGAHRVSRSIPDLKNGPDQDPRSFLEIS
jgi:hypothetical protein